MRINKLGLAFVMISALMWMQSFTYAFRYIDYTKTITHEIVKLFLSQESILSFLCAIMCAVMGMMLIKTDFN